MRKTTCQKGFAQVIVLLLILGGLGLALYFVSHTSFFQNRAALEGTRIEFSGPGVSADKLTTTSQTVYVNAFYVPPATTSSTPAPTTAPISAPVTPTQNVGIGNSASVGTGTSATTTPTFPNTFKLSNTQAGLAQPCPVVNGSALTCQIQFIGNPTTFAGWKLTDGSGQKTVWARFLKNGLPLGPDVSATITYQPTTASPTPTTTSFLPPDVKYNRVFVTSTTYNGNLGGLSGADQKCQDRANASYVGGTWKAWISGSSSSSSSASLRLVHSTNPYKLLNGTTVANNWSDLTDGLLSQVINVTEKGQTIPSNPIPFVWSGTNTNGNYNSAATCRNWTRDQTTEYGTYGQVGFPRIEWTWVSQMSCSNQNHLYCFEQSTNTPPIGGTNCPAGYVWDVQKGLCQPTSGPSTANIQATVSSVDTTLVAGTSTQVFQIIAYNGVGVGIQTYPVNSNSRIRVNSFTAKNQNIPNAYIQDVILYADTGLTSGTFTGTIAVTDSSGKVAISIPLTLRVGASTPTPSPVVITTPPTNLRSLGCPDPARLPKVSFTIPDTATGYNLNVTALRRDGTVAGTRNSEVNSFGGSFTRTGATFGTGSGDGGVYKWSLALKYPNGGLSQYVDGPNVDCNAPVPTNLRSLGCLGPSQMPTAGFDLPAVATGYSLKVAALRSNGTTARTSESEINSFGQSNTKTQASFVTGSSDGGVYKWSMSIKLPNGQKSDFIDGPDINCSAPIPAASLPVITSIIPSSGPVGSKVTVNFQNIDPNGSYVLFNGRNSTTVSNDNASKFEATVPVGATSGPITILDKFRRQITSSQQFQVTGVNNPPTLTITRTNYFNFYSLITAIALDPDKDNITLTMSGQSLGSFGPYCSYLASGNRKCILYVPARLAGKVTATADDGKGHKITQDLNFNALALITGFTPTVGAVGEKIKISYSNLVPGRVYFGNTQSLETSIVFDSGKSYLVATIPPGAKTGRIQVESNDGQTALSSSDFRVVSGINYPPALTFTKSSNTFWKTITATSSDPDGDSVTLTASGPIAFGPFCYNRTLNGKPGRICTIYARATTTGTITLTASDGRGGTSIQRIGLP